MVSNADEKKDPLAIPAVIIFTACLLWVGYDLYGGIMARQEIADRINTAVVLHNDRNAPGDALRLLNLAENEWNRRKGKAAEVVLQRLRPFDPGFGERAAVIHTALAYRFSDAQVAPMAERHYVLALLKDPEARNVTGKLAQECFFTRNYELGALSCKLAIEKNEADGPTRKLSGYFEKHK